MTAGAAVTLRTASAAQTEALGERIGAQLRAGDVVALSGELGAGKTVFTRGLARGAGARGLVASPTFTLIREYRGPTTVYHADLYRLDAPEQLLDTGLEEILAEGTGITVIEWAEKARHLLPPEYLWVEIRFTEGDDEREVELRPHGRRYGGIVAALGGE